MTLQTDILENRNKFLEQLHIHDVDHDQMQCEKIRGLQDTVRDLLKGQSMSPQIMLYIRIAAALIELLKDKDVTKDDLEHVAKGLGIEVPEATEENKHALDTVLEAVLGVFK